MVRTFRRVWINKIFADDLQRYVYIFEWSYASNKSLKSAIDFSVRNGLFCIKKEEVDSMQGYCVKCRAKREMKDTKAITMKNGKPATQGICPTCGTKMFRIGKA